MTDAPAVISGSLVDVRNVGVHKSVKLTIHVPEELAMQVMDAFGWPTAANPIYVAIARLDKSVSRQYPTAEREPGQETPPPSPPVRATRSLAQKVGMLCNDGMFQQFLREQYAEVWREVKEPSAPPGETAADVIRSLCAVETRAQITADTPAGAQWQAIDSEFGAWRLAP